MMAKRKSNPALSKRIPAKSSSKEQHIIADHINADSSSFVYANDIEKAINILSTTDTSVTGTVSAFERLEHRLNSYARDASGEAEMVRDIQLLKTSIVGLEELRQPIKKLEDFLRNNAEFMIVATETKGKLNVFETALSSMQKRLEHLEEKSYKTKDRTIAIWALFISIIVGVGSAVLAWLK